MSKLIDSGYLSCLQDCACFDKVSRSDLYHKRKRKEDVSETGLEDKMKPLIQGVLYVTVHEARDLPVTETASSKISGFFHSIAGKKHKKDYTGTYVKVYVGKTKVGETRCIDYGDEKNPQWSEKFRGDVAHESSRVLFQRALEYKPVLKSMSRGVPPKEVYGDTVGEDKKIGLLKISCADIREMPDDPTSWRLLNVADDEEPEERDPQWFPLVGTNGRLSGGSLRLTIVFKAPGSLVHKESISDCYFSQQKYNHVTLYQDAITPHDPLFDEITYEDGSTYEATNCWKDLYRAIRDAKTMIYITGWSVWTGVVLVRDGDEDEITLGDLLLEKANEGVKVLGMVWDEKTSNEVIPGLMGTHDEETARFFDGTNVHMLLVYRKKDRTNILTDAIYNTCYSHHQKTIIVDADHPEDDSKRRLVAFVGGLDVTSGRYDMPAHPLYNTLKGEHQKDFYQNCIASSVDVGPRQPWHDIHSRVEGPVAYDVVCNFEERWRKQAPKRLKAELVDLSGEDFDLRCPGPCDENEMWQCQLFRSITTDSAYFREELMDRLTKKAHAMTDDSIHRAYVHQIRRAQKYVYIENQYFQGSAYAWEDDRSIKAHHVIPMELVSRIVEKIHAGERFAVYVVIPMYPEGDPATGAVQEMLHWQHKTISMMYTRIAKAIAETETEATPRDYLSFYCLGTRESAEAPEDLDAPEEDSTLAKYRTTRRFQVYVHSKMLIVDDAYIIVGSANINQRSMGGTRDTEIAIGSFQENHTCVDGVLPRGRVHGFRKALWVEHMQSMDEVFDDPSSLECIQKVNEIAESNWEIYSAVDTEDTQGHLLAYPYTIAEDGAVLPMEGSENFPDTDASVIGKKSAFLPAKLTT